MTIVMDSGRKGAGNRGGRSGRLSERE